MRSAYLVLGVPGDATAQEIETAFRAAEGRLSGERLADSRSAYQVLRDPASRSAHDRKLQQGAHPRPRQAVRAESDPPSAASRVMRAGWLVLLLLLAAGTALSWRNAEVRKERELEELATRKAANEEIARKRQAEAQKAAARAAMNAEAEANERRLARESQLAVARARSIAATQEAEAAYARRAEAVQQQRGEAASREEERRAAYESRLRTERDKQRVRELCWQKYRRPDC